MAGFQAATQVQIVVRYIDTGSRAPEHALGSWLERMVLDEPELNAVRWQTGFFTADTLNYFRPAFEHTKRYLKTTHLLVGANDLMTSRDDAEALLVAAGGARANLQIGIVSFSNAYFHPKAVHVERQDGSMAAYVGSANLTRAGASVHVEAGITLDTNDGDDPGVLREIAASVDGWFSTQRPGLYPISSSQDLDTLLAKGIFGTSVQLGHSLEGANGPSTAAPLRPLLQIPPREQVGRSDEPIALWSKRLTPSDAQRKRSGNQRGSIVLNQAGFPIDAQSYFRRVLFKDARWRVGETRTGEARHTANIPFRVSILGHSLGEIRLTVSYAPNREAAQNNYTSLLHVGDLTETFRDHDLTGHLLRISQRVDRTFDLSIGA